MTLMLLVVIKVVNKIIVNLSKNNKFRNLMHALNIEAIKKPTFLNSNIKKIFNHLKKLIIKALILWHFDPKSYIQIKIDELSYAIGRVLSQFNLNSNVSINK